MACVSDEDFSETEGLEICVTNWKLMYVLFKETGNTCKPEIVGAVYHISCSTTTGEDLKLVLPAYNALKLQNFDCTYGQKISTFIPNKLKSPFLLSNSDSFNLDHIYSIAYCLLIETLFKNYGSRGELIWDAFPPMFRFGVKALFYRHQHGKEISIVSHFVWTKEGRKADIPIFHVEDVSSHIVFPPSYKDDVVNDKTIGVTLLRDVYTFISRENSKIWNRNRRFENIKSISPVGEAMFKMLGRKGFEICTSKFSVCTDDLKERRYFGAPCKYYNGEGFCHKNETRFCDIDDVYVRSNFRKLHCINLPDDKYLRILIGYIVKKQDIFTKKPDIVKTHCLFRFSDKLDNFVGGAYCAHNILNYIFDVPFSERYVSLPSHIYGSDFVNEKLSLEHVPTMICFESGKLYNSPVPLFYSESYIHATNGLKGFSTHVSLYLYFKYVFMACIRYFFRGNEYVPSTDLDRPSLYKEGLNNVKPCTFQPSHLHKHSKMIQLAQDYTKNGVSKGWPGIYVDQGTILEVDVRNCYANLIKNRSRICGMFVDHFINLRGKAKTKEEGKIYKRFLCQLYGNLCNNYSQLYEEIRTAAVNVSLQMASFVCFKGYDLIRIVRDGMLFVVPNGVEFSVGELEKYMGEDNISFSVEEPSDIAIIAHVNAIALLRSNKVVTKGILSTGQSPCVKYMITCALEALLCNYISSSSYKKYSYESFLIRMCGYLSDKLDELKKKEGNIDNRYIFQHPFNGRMVQHFTHWIHYRDYPTRKVTFECLPSLFAETDFVSVLFDKKICTENYSAYSCYSLSNKGNSRVIDMINRNGYMGSIWSDLDNFSVIKSRLVSRHCLLRGYQIDERSYYYGALLALKPIYVTFGNFLRSYDQKLVSGVVDLSNKYMEVVDKVSNSQSYETECEYVSLRKNVKELPRAESLAIYNKQVGANFK